MQLQHIRRQGLDDRGKSGVVRVDGKRDLARPPGHAGAQRLRAIQRDMPGARLEEHEAGHIGAR
jgi:hypothetical protein